MIWIEVVARAVVGLVFLVAGVGKLADPSGSVAALAAFGVPHRFTRIGGWLVPLAELLVAVLLIPQPTAAWAALVAAAMLLGFAIAIARTLARGATPDCHCFGVVHSAPISRRLVWRNAVLCTIALGVVVSRWWR